MRICIFAVTSRANLILELHLVGSKDRVKDTISWWIAEACCWWCFEVGQGNWVQNTYCLSQYFKFICWFFFLKIALFCRMDWKEEATRKLGSWMRLLRWLEQVFSSFSSCIFWLHRRLAWSWLMRKIKTTIHCSL